MSKFGFGNGFFDGLFDHATGIPVLILVVLWSLFWKGLALWHAARRGDAWWFTGILLINTAGIFEIIYLFGFAKLKAGQLFGDGGR